MTRVSSESSRRRKSFAATADDNKNNTLQTWFLASCLTVAVLSVAYVVFFAGTEPTAPVQPAARPLQLHQIPVDGQRAYSWLQRICDLGPRVSGTAGMARQREMLTNHFAQLGGIVESQNFAVRHPVDGSAVPMANLVVHWHPDRAERILLCAHYDTRPFPDRDPNPQLRQGIFIGANDGASGVAVLAELAHHMSTVTNVGVDFVLFDGEEFIYNDRRDAYFLGSEYFARDYVANPPAYRYRYAVLLDMVGDAQLQIFYERNSVSWRDSAPLVHEIWRTAKRLGVREFIARPGHKVLDDHLKLHDVAGIPSCDIIDFDYPRPGLRSSYWHTTLDTPDKCAPLSLAKVGWVVLEWIKQVQ
jgi:hypothetical protein